MTDVAPDTLKSTILVSGDGIACVALRGHLGTETIPQFWKTLKQRLGAQEIKTLEVNAADLRSTDDSGLALLQYIVSGKMMPEATTSVIGLKADLDKRFHEFPIEDCDAVHSSLATKKYSIPKKWEPL